jgi:hypothetical protein
LENRFVDVGNPGRNLEMSRVLHPHLFLILNIRQDFACVLFQSALGKLEVALPRQLQIQLVQQSIRLAKSLHLRQLRFVVGRISR